MSDRQRAANRGEIRERWCPFPVPAAGIEYFQLRAVRLPMRRAPQIGLGDRRTIARPRNKEEQKTPQALPAGPCETRAAHGPMRGSRCAHDAPVGLLEACPRLELSRLGARAECELARSVDRAPTAGRRGPLRRHIYSVTGEADFVLVVSATAHRAEHEFDELDAIADRHGDTIAARVPRRLSRSADHAKGR